MSARSFDIASGKETQRRTQKGGMYSPTRVDLKLKNGQGIGRDIVASVVSAVLPKAISALGQYGTDRLAQKIRGNGKGKGKKCGGSWKLR